MKEREKWKGKRQGSKWTRGKRGAPAPHRAHSLTHFTRHTDFCLYCNGQGKFFDQMRNYLVSTRQWKVDIFSIHKSDAFCPVASLRVFLLVSYFALRICKCCSLTVLFVPVRCRCWRFTFSSADVTQHFCLGVYLSGQLRNL